tara:strand:+ start:1764 stop:2135 length:372 start_codon:yes stop_codon:yes gene_type:complete
MIYRVTAICIKRLQKREGTANGSVLREEKYQTNIYQSFITDDNKLTANITTLWYPSVPRDCGDKSGIRQEIIDTEENELFSDCKTRYDVEDRYESFWNRTQAGLGYDNKEIVKVLKVEAIDEE